MNLVAVKIFGYTEETLPYLSVMGFEVKLGPAFGWSGEWIKASDPSWFFAGIQYLSRNGGGGVRLHSLCSLEFGGFSNNSDPGIGGGGYNGPIMCAGDKPVVLMGVGPESKVVEELLRWPSSVARPIEGDLSSIVSRDLGPYGHWLYAELRALPRQVRDALFARFTMDELAGIE